jgi:hypothetical protein
MKTKYIFIIILGLLILGIVFTFSLLATGCTKNVQNQTQAPDVNNDILKASRGPERKQDSETINMQAYFQYGLKEYGISDFNSGSLMNLMNNKISSIRFYSALLLGERKERSAIPKLVEALNDKSFSVVLAASRALLKMDNRKGIQKLEGFCEKVSKEFEDGNRNNERLVDQSDALAVLADAGEVSAIPYLRKLLRSEVWSLRLSSLRSLNKLYEKDKTVLKDIASMAEDDKPTIRKEALDFVQKIAQDPNNKATQLR